MADVLNTVRPAVGHPLTPDDLALEDLESIRLLLTGRSVIDWHRLDFRDLADVDRFLRVNEFSPDSADEMARLEELRHDAVDYLARVFGLELPAEVAEEVAARDLFLVASRQGKNRKWACVTLKVMHIIHHLAGREALVRLPIPDHKIFHATELKVMQVVEELRAAGHPISEFQWSRKPRDSLITKLLSKRSTLAAKIYDKLRFRLIVDAHADLIPMLAALTRQLIPFNYIIPGESVNQLISFDAELQLSDHLRPMGSALQEEETTSSEEIALPVNEFSSPEYRIINFVADLPVRIGSLLHEDIEVPHDCGHVIFVLCEFQLCDAVTAESNESGESSHDAYKQRQHRKVRARLMAEPKRGGNGHA